MTREERLEHCGVCTKRKMNPKIGLVCSLTNDHANFENTCIDFELDAKERTLNMKLAAAGRAVGDSKDFKKNKQIGVFLILLGIL